MRLAPLAADRRTVGRTSGIPALVLFEISKAQLIHLEAYEVASIRYLVNDADRAIAFYTQSLGFKLKQKMSPAFAYVSKGDLTLWLSGPQSSAARPMPDGRRPEPGGWNRLVLEVQDLSARVIEMKEAGIHFRNEIVVGPGGKQIVAEDPDGNPVEFFEPAS